MTYIVLICGYPKSKIPTVKGHDIILTAPILSVGLMPFILNTGASDNGLGSVLSQVQCGK